MDRRLLAERGFELRGIGRGDLARVERPEPLLELQRSAERGLHGDLLVERHAHQQGERLGRKQPVGLVVAGVMKPVRRRRRGHG